MAADITLNSGSGGAIIATDPTTSSEHYQLIKLAQGAVGTFTLVSTANPMPVITASGGLVQISGIPSVVVTTSGGVWATVPSVNVTTSGGLGASNVRALSSGTVTLSSNPTVVLSSPTSLSSGTVTLSSNPTVISASSGLIQALFPVNSSAGFGPVTSSAGILASLSSGTITLSSAISLSSGVVTLSSQPGPWSSAPGFNVPVVSVSSGLIQLSSQISVTATAGTNPWSSAPGFNIPVVNVSSGLVQALGVVAASSGVPPGLSFANNITTGAAALSVNIKGTPGLWFGHILYNVAAAPRSVKIYNTTSAPTIGSTSNIVSYLPVPGSTGGGGSNLAFNYGVYCSNGIGYTVTANAAATDTGAPAANDVSVTILYV